ncbi:hypothetical protein C0J52_15525 [Blattella germanica]|nr:hypothetical protein C0J52_15525 [Blattella germanica]
METSKLSLPQAQEQFVDMMRRLDENAISGFFSWIQNNWINDLDVKSNDMSDAMLDTIARDLRDSLPLEAILPSENIRPPSSGKNADCDPKTTVHVDAFLYDDELVDKLCEDGHLARNYCTQCGSHKTRPLTFISHSASTERLHFIFQCMLPPLDGKIVLDIGSRLGAVLYGAYVFTQAEKIVGVEMNSELCAMQMGVVCRYKLQDRIQVVEADISSRPDIIMAADVIIMNNVFEFFLSTKRQHELWSFLRHTIKTGTLLVTIPPLEQSETGIDLSTWVEEIPAFNLEGAKPTMSEEEMQELGLYKVK